MTDSPQKIKVDSAEKVAELLGMEAEAIHAAARRMSPTQVRAALDLLAGCSGKIVISGVGKSGIIAQKIAQTMTSTGTVAIFLHPSDALHGGLGVVASGDVMIALSNSGETEELLALMPALKQRGVAIISIVGDLDSSLANEADAVLDAGVDKEACPLNLAPTTSTTVALAIGDALSMALAEAKGLSSEQFAANHPAGRLGKRLTLRVCDLMRESPTVSPDDGWLEVVRSISKHGLGAVNVVADGRLVGIVTDGDLRRTIEKTLVPELQNLTAAAMMTASPVTVSPTVLAVDALKLMEDRPSQISVLPVVDGDECVGLLRLHDIARAGL